MVMAKTKRKTTAKVVRAKKTVAKKRPTVNKRPLKKRLAETDSKYLLKLVLYFILGTLWIRLLHVNIGPFEHFSLPVGLILGLVIISRERIQVDRKVGFAVLLVATFISFYLPVGITI